MDNDNKRMAAAALGISDGARLADESVSIAMVDVLKALAWQRSHEGRTVDPDIYSKLESLRRGKTLVLRRAGGIEIVRIE